MTKILFFAGLALIAAGVGFIYWPAGVITLGILCVFTAVLLRKVPDAPARPPART